MRKQRRRRGWKGKGGAGEGVEREREGGTWWKGRYFRGMCR